MRLCTQILDFFHTHIFFTHEIYLRKAEGEKEERGTDSMRCMECRMEEVRERRERGGGVLTG